MQGRPGRSACRPESDASKITKAGLFMLPALVLAHAPAAGARAQVIYVVGVLGRRPRIPAGCAGPLRALICECWQRDARARPPFAAILLRLRAMQARPNPSLSTHLCACHHTVLIERSAVGKRPLTCILCCITCMDR